MTDSGFSPGIEEKCCAALSPTRNPPEKKRRSPVPHSRNRRKTVIQIFPRLQNSLRKASCCLRSRKELNVIISDPLTGESYLRYPPAAFYLPTPFLLSFKFTLLRSFSHPAVTGQNPFSGQNRSPLQPAETKKSGNIAAPETILNCQTPSDSVS